LALVLDEKVRAIQGWKEGWGDVLGADGVGKSWRAWVKDSRMDEGEKQKLAEALRRGTQGRPRFERYLGWAAVLTGAVALVGWLVWEKWHSEEEVVVEAALGQFLGTSSEWDRGEWKWFEGTSGEMVDWLFLNGFEGVRLPERVSSGVLKAGRIVRWRDVPVAVMVASESKFLACILPAQAVGAGDLTGLVSGRLNVDRWRADWTLEGSYFVLIAEALPVP
jgi:hypothetical protein